MIGILASIYVAQAQASTITCKSSIGLVKIEDDKSVPVEAPNERELKLEYNGPSSANFRGEDGGYRFAADLSKRDGHAGLAIVDSETESQVSSESLYSLSPKKPELIKATWTTKEPGNVKKLVSVFCLNRP